MRKSKIFCRGICKIWNRTQTKCISCKVYICGVCQFIYKNRTYCFNCCMENVDIARDLKEEYNDMIMQLEKRKQAKKVLLKSEV